MTGSVVAQTTNAELVREFIDLAKRTGALFARGQPEGRLRRTPERQQLVTRLRSVGEELRARAALDEARRLLEDGDIDVRGWAAGQFLGMLPKLARATFTGLCIDRPATEVLEQLRHARERPPSRPTLREMSTDALVQRFVNAATREYWTRFAGDGKGSPLDLKLRNRIVGELGAIMVEFKRRDALALLLPFLESDNITVRAEAACATITIDPERAVKVLEAVIASNDSYELGAAWRALENFRAGKPVVGGVG
jgi:HEAT repeat protein